MTSIREHLIGVVEALDSTIHVGAPRSVSARVCHAEVPDAVDAILNELGIDGNEERTGDDSDA